MKTSTVRAGVATAFGVAAVLGISLMAIPSVAQIKEGAEIEAVSQQYREAWQRGDLDRVMQFWTADAKSIGPGAVATGAAAIRASLEQSRKLGIHDLRHEEREIFGGGDSVVEVTRSAVLDGDGKTMFALRYMTLWQKSGGQWRIHREFVVPIGPAPAA